MAEQQQQQNQPQQGQQPQGQEVIDNEFDPIIWSESEDIRVQDLSGSLIQEALTLIKVGVHLIVHLNSSEIWLMNDLLTFA